jgi:hypothetical protein
MILQNIATTPIFNYSTVNRTNTFITLLEMWLHVVWRVVMGNVTFQTNLILGNTSVRTSKTCTFNKPVSACVHTWTRASMNMHEKSTHRTILGNWLNLLHLVLTPETKEMCILKKQSSAKVSPTMSKLQQGIKSCRPQNGGGGTVTYHIGQSTLLLKRPLREVSPSDKNDIHTTTHCRMTH